MSEQALKGISTDYRTTQASVSAFSYNIHLYENTYRGELVVSKGLYCAIQPYLQDEGSSTAIAKSEMRSPAKKALTAACSCAHSGGTTRACTGILML